MASVQEVQKLVKTFARKKISAADFANRFNLLLRSAVRSSDPSVRDLAIAVHGPVSHFFHGLISEQEFRSKMKLLCEVEASQKQGAVNQLIVQATSILPGVNWLAVGEVAYQGNPAISGTSREGVFSSAEPLEV